MSNLKKYNLKGEELGEIQVEDTLSKAEANSQMVKDYIVALRANKRQWSASTKTRSEVKHTTKKPRPQKGTGRARQGMLVAPQFRGGGIVFGPKPKFDQHVRINKKERKAAIRFLLGEKIRNGQLHVLNNLSMDEPKTKEVASFLKGRAEKGRFLILGDAEYSEVEGEKNRITVRTEKHANFSKSLRNIPKAYFKLVSNVNGYDLMIANHVIVTEKALREISEWLK